MEVHGRPLPPPEHCLLGGYLVSDPILRPNLYLSCGERLVRSRDQGETWQDMTPPDLGPYGALLAVDPSLPLLYAVTSAGSVFGSTNGGESWTVRSQAKPYTRAISAAQGTLYVGSPASYDAFAAKFQNNGDLVWATYLGGSSNDDGLGIAVDGSGTVYVAGTTQSGDFPVTPGAYDGGSVGGSAAFVTSLSPDRGLLQYSARLRVYGDIWSMAVDPASAVYVAGETRGMPIVTTSGVVYPETGSSQTCNPGPPCTEPGMKVRPFVSKLAPGGATPRLLHLRWP